MWVEDESGLGATDCSACVGWKRGVVRLRVGIGVSRLMGFVHLVAGQRYWNLMAVVRIDVMNMVRAEFGKESVNRASSEQTASVLSESCGLSHGSGVGRIGRYRALSVAVCGFSVDLQNRTTPPCLNLQEGWVLGAVGNTHLPRVPGTWCGWKRARTGVWAYRCGWKHAPTEGAGHLVRLETCAYRGDETFNPTGLSSSQNRFNDSRFAFNACQSLV